MTVAQLIAALQGMPQDMPVRVSLPDGRTPLIQKVGTVTFWIVPEDGKPNAAVIYHSATASETPR